MIMEEDLNKAIAECQGQRNPNANTCIKLAAFLTIKRELYGESHNKEEPMEVYSFSGPNSDILYSSNTEFGQAILNKDLNDIIAVMDELMSTLQIVNPKLYSSVMRRI